jgi:carbamoyl-phosphate synthase small subunit
MNTLNIVMKVTNLSYLGRARLSTRVPLRSFATHTDPFHFGKATKKTLAIEPPQHPATFHLKTGQTFNGTSFGAPDATIAGEVVFTTSLVGYPESMTDPSYRGQILVFTQPLIGNYGVPGKNLDKYGLLEHFESDRIHVAGIVVSDYAQKYSHWRAVQSLGAWCASEGVPALSGVDTRALVHILRGQGSTLGEIVMGDNKVQFADPNVRNLASEVSVASRQVFNKGGKLKIALIDVGTKYNIIRCLANRGAEVHLLPWNHDLAHEGLTKYDGVFISNGPGDPKSLDVTAQNLSKVVDESSKMTVPVPIFGICMGNLLLGRSIGLDTYKLPFGNRGHNQPALNQVTGSCIITSQNHGYALKDDNLPNGWEKYFVNANDNSNEGIRHVSLPFTSVQFHPEATAGPEEQVLFQ